MARAGLGVVDARGLHRAIAEIGERALHRDDAAAGRQQRRDRIVALDRDRLRLDGRARNRGQQHVVRLGRRPQARRLLEVADRRIGLRAIDAVGRAVIEAAPHSSRWISATMSERGRATSILASAACAAAPAPRPERPAHRRRLVGEDRRRMRPRLHEQRIDQDRDGGKAGHRRRPSSPAAGATPRAAQSPNNDQRQAPHGPAAEFVVIHSRCRCSHGSPHAVFLIKASAASTTRSNEGCATFEGLRAGRAASQLSGRRTRHARALAQPACDVHLAAVQRHQALHDRKPEPGAVMAAIIGAARLEERPADARQIVGADANAGVLDRDHDVGRLDRGARP